MTDYDKALIQLRRVDVPSIPVAEFSARIATLANAMRATGLDGVWLDASPSLTYFTGLSLHPSERLHGALIRADGSLTYVTPNFERPKLETMLQIPGEIAVWEEDADPFALIADRVSGRIALDPAMTFGSAGRLMDVPDLTVCSAQDLIAAQRRKKSAAELAILQAAMNASYAVHKAVHAGLRPGISTREVAAFVDAAHQALGLTPVFVAVQFGEATAYPHGVPYPQTLTPGDMVLVDLGGSLQGYNSDLTRTFVFGTPTARQSHLWACEHRAQMAGFAAASAPGVTCEAVDAAARGALVADGFGPGYLVPGLPHRTGHGLGLELHEEPWIVAGNQTVLEPGMCFSIEPMLCVYGECGVRLEDIVYMTESGPVWFCPPATSPVTPFS